MPRDEKQRQKALQKQAAKRKDKKKSLVRAAAALTPRARLHAAAHWPVYACWVSKTWATEGLLTQILVARRSPDDEYALGVFLVDTACLGVKNAFARIVSSRGEYEEHRQFLDERTPLMATDLNHAAKIIREAVNYAAKLGFDPNPDYYDATILLVGAEPDASPATIPLGVQGKPFFRSGPSDNPRRIIQHLLETVGVGNFDYLVGLDSEGPDDEWEEV